MGTAHLNYQSSADVMTEIRSIVPAYTEVNYETMKVDGVLRRFEPATKPRFLPFKLDKVPQFSSKEFPLTLMTERNLFYYHGACLTEQVKGMNLIKKEEVLHLSPSDAARLGIADGTVVKVESQHGSAECTAQATSGMPEGVAFTSINRIVGSPLFSTRAPNTKACAIRISEHPLRPEV
jgi:predicted molibdopterin-dependent oxidoreductase YjgC